ncbi:MAG: CotH kinase family protein [Flavobacteriales bacterium]|nr:CotH kinase family protein [Flavobacteriales bacterium]
MKKLALFTLWVMGVPTIWSQVVINEYSCSNASHYVDNFGNYEDWIELYNTGSTAYNLSGHFLSDRLNNPTKWPMPNVTIPAGGRMIFFCSGRNINTGPGPYHTNFKLTQTAFEKIIFAGPGGVILDSVTTIPAQRNHGRGRTTDGASTWSLFLNPTPNAPNTGASPEYAAKPTANLQAGFYPGPITVTLSTTEPNSVIRYTTNGSEPTATSSPYTGPITINSTTVLRFRTFSNNPSVPESFIETNTYFINAPNHQIPVMSVSGPYAINLIQGNAGLDGTPVHFEFFDGTPAHNFVVEAYGTADHHGNDSWAMSPHKGIDFVVRDQLGYNHTMNYSFFPGVPRDNFDRLILKSGASDGYPGYNTNRAAHIRDAFIQTLSQKIGLDTDERSMIWAALYVNGQYWGLYDVREKVHNDGYTDHYYNQGQFDIDLLSYWGGLQIRYGSDTGWVALYNYIMANNLADQNVYNNVASRLNIDNVIDYMILNVWGVNSDWINWNTMWWRGRKAPGVKWRYVLWDMDNVFNLGENFSGWQTTGYTASPCDLENNFQNAGPNMGFFDIFGKLMDNPTFKAKFASRLGQLLSGPLDCPYVIAHLDSMAAVAATEMPRHIQRWGGSLTQWQNNLQFLRDQINGRCAHLSNTVNTITPCYDITGPFTVVYNVSPAGSGTISLNGDLLPSYPHSMVSYGNITNALVATPNPGYVFSHWEVKNHTFNPDTLSPAASYHLSVSDTIIAHFVLENPAVNLTFVVNPPLSGNIDISGFTPPAYPWTGPYIPNSSLSLSATPMAGYVFDHWSAGSHTFAPGNTADVVTSTVVGQDTIVAHFVQVQPPAPTQFTLTLDVEPAYSGSILFNGQNISFFPHTVSLDSNTVISLSAMPAMGFAFQQWTSQNHSLTPSGQDPMVTFNIQKQDTVIAWFHFVPEPERPVPQVFFPTSFTPDDDNLNDFFQAYYNEHIASGEILIFNRWGEVVFQSKNLDFRWDGKRAGSPCPQGVYVYVFRYRTKLEEKEFVKTGAILLLR